MKMHVIDQAKYKSFIKQLKPCPFCGETNNLDFALIDDAQDPKLAVKCCYCHYVFPISIYFESYTMKDLVEKWNRRPREVK